MQHEIDKKWLFNNNKVLLKICFIIPWSTGRSRAEMRPDFVTSGQKTFGNGLTTFRGCLTAHDMLKNTQKMLQIKNLQITVLKTMTVTRRFSW